MISDTVMMVVGHLNVIMMFYHAFYNPPISSPDYTVAFIILLVTVPMYW